MKKTFEYIKGIAKQYEYRDDFRKEHRAEYAYAQRNGWLDYLGLKYKNAAVGHYTYDVCRDMARGCRTRTEFFEKSKTAYRTSLHNGWIDDFTWLKKTFPRRPRGFWTLERTKYALSVCSCYKELEERFKGARCAAQKYGIYDLLYKKEEPKRMSDEDRCLVAALGYVDEKQMREYSPKEYALAKKNGWLEEYKKFWV